jgi:hypothetical protein
MKDKIITHMVLDTIFTEEEGQETFSGTESECYDFIQEQAAGNSMAAYGMVIVPMRVHITHSIFTDDDLIQKLKNSNAPEFIKGIDYKMLREQKEILINNFEGSRNTDIVDAIDGILNLLDSLQDYVADDLEMGNMFVFGLNDETED